jgi:hypothetical protein
MRRFQKNEKRSEHNQKKYQVKVDKKEMHMLSKWHVHQNHY